MFFFYGKKVFPILDRLSRDSSAEWPLRGGQSLSAAAMSHEHVPDNLQLSNSKVFYCLT